MPAGLVAIDVAFPHLFAKCTSVFLVNRFLKREMNIVSNAAIRIYLVCPLKLSVGPSVDMCL